MNRQDLSSPGEFVQVRRSLDVSCEPPGLYAGFKARVLLATVGEYSAFIKHWTQWAELAEIVAPLVISWNLGAHDQETGAFRPWPAPAEAGPAIFADVELGLLQWLASAACAVARQAPTPPPLAPAAPGVMH